MPHTLTYAEAFKKAGVKAVISPAGGFGDYAVIDDAIASGKCDTVDMARSYMVDPEFALKAAEGRPEDRIPCVRCNKCHNSPKNKWMVECSVNPMLGLAHHQEAMVKPATRSKNVAIIGGGPAGMRAAIFCRERWLNNPNFTGILKATTKVEPGRVTYVDKDGEHVLECGDIILSGGMRKDDELVASYFGCAPQVVVCGDCKQPGALTNVNFTAYAAACSI